jgi:hypothetical protein
MVKAKLRAAETLEVTHFFPTVPIIASDYLFKCKRIQFSFRRTFERSVSLNKSQGTLVYEYWLLKSKRKNNLILVQNGKTAKFVPKKSFEFCILSLLREKE